MMTKSKEASASPAASRAPAGQRHVGDEHARRGREMRVRPDAPASARRNRAISGGLFDQHDRRASGQRDARPGRPRRRRRRNRRAGRQKPEGTAAASIMASMPARWPRAFRLHQPEIAAVEGVDRLGGRCSPATASRASAVLAISLAMPASARMRRAASTSSSATMMRRGRMPIEPSSTLMFWSATRQPMPASRSSDFDEGDDDGVVGADEFFHAAKRGRLGGRGKGGRGDLWWRGAWNGCARTSWSCRRSGAKVELL